jgi:hypothetical protein
MLLGVSMEASCRKYKTAAPIAGRRSCSCCAGVRNEPAADNRSGNGDSPRHALQRRGLPLHGLKGATAVP